MHVCEIDKNLLLLQIIKKMC